MKKLIILISVLFLTGCTVNYNLVIDNHKNIYESVSLLDDNDNILKYSTTINSFLNEMSEKFEGYNVNKIIDTEKSGFELKRNYSNFESYGESLFFTTMFEKYDITSEKKYFSFTTLGEYYKNNVFSVPLESTFDYNVDDFKVNIKFYNKVLSSNADSVDKSTNTYTWNIESKSDLEQIQFELFDSVRYDVMFKDMISRHKFLIIGIIAVVALIIIGSINLKKVIIKNNKI